MTISEVEDFLNAWSMDQERGFKYYDYGLFSTEYVVIQKVNEGIYKIIKSRSTCNDGPFNKSQMEKLLRSNRLVPHGGDGWGLNFRKTKCGNCECGAWATRNPDCHARWCPMHRWES